jgi:hypothetical protein
VFGSLIVHSLARLPTPPEGESRLCQQPYTDRPTCHADVGLERRHGASERVVPLQAIALEALASVFRSLKEAEGPRLWDRGRAL